MNKPTKKTGAKKATMIVCASCDGAGKTPLPDELQTTLDMFAGKARFTAADLHTKAQDSVSVNAMNNRVERLRGLGLLTRSRQGRNWLYARA
jgi:hypothetical protein